MSVHGNTDLSHSTLVYRLAQILLSELGVPTQQAVKGLRLRRVARAAQNKSVFLLARKELRQPLQSRRRVPEHAAEFRHSAGSDFQLPANGSRSLRRSSLEYGFELGPFGRRL